MKAENIIEVTISDDRKSLYDKLNEQFNPEGSSIRKYQHHLTKTLVEFDGFCRDNDISYSIAYGTMLGAVRHKGFIPWDDDADLFMDRENYEKLHRLMRGKYNELTPNLSVAMGIRPELWSPPYAYIDIFILDASPDNYFLRVIKQSAAILAYCLVKARGVIDSRDIKKWQKIKIWHMFIPIAFFAKISFWKHFRDNIPFWFPKCQSTYYQAYNNTLGYTLQKYKKTDCEVIEKIEFEKHYLSCYKGYDSLLQVSYGNYMQIPSKLHVHGFVDGLDQECILKSH